MTSGRRSARELLEQLFRDEGLDDAWEPEAPDERALLDVAALPRVFNRRLIEQVLLPAAAQEAQASVVSLDWLLGHESIEVVPGNPGLYRMRKRHRGERVASWVRSLTATSDIAITNDGSARADRFVAVSLALANTVIEWGPAWELERLYQLIAADPAQASAEIAAQYATADAVFDMVRCCEIVALMDERDDLLTDQLLRQRADLKRYYTSRTAWTEAYAQSAFALERTFMRDAFTWTQSDDPRWIACVEARGGMGKSMFVRWLISRQCVPEPARIPCARIDFDFALPTALAEYPWLVIPQLVAQLEVQLRLEGTEGATTELQRLANQVREQERIALESQGAAQGAGRALTLERSQRFGAEMAERFGRALHERARGPVLVVFDTIEEAFLRAEFTSTQGRNVIESVLELLVSVQRAHPRLKVIFAGRFSPSGRDGAGEFHTRYAGQWIPITLTPFGDDEAREFLVRVRKLRDDDRIASVIGKSAGLPLVLALWADIVLARDEITAREIADSPAADLAYLVERVIDRLHNPQLQWVIRYGVIPRRLTRAFFDGVLVPALRAAMHGTAPHDIPARDRLAALGTRERFSTSLLARPEDLDADVLWNDLEHYVSSSSFVYRSADDAQAIAFHVEVVEPMRRVLREDQEATFRALHAAAVTFYEQQAAGADTPERRTVAMREAIHHLMQANAPGARLEQWLDQARDTGDRAWARVLVEELLSPEYAQLDESAAPLAPALVSLAHTLRLDTLISDATAASGSDRGLAWVAVVRAVAAYKAFTTRHAGAGPPRPGWLEIVEAEGVLNTQGANAALPLFEHALSVARDDALRLPASLGAADAADRLGQSERAGMHARMALGLFERAMPVDRTPRRRQDLARIFEALGDYETMIGLLHGSDLMVTSDPAAPSARLVDALLATGRATDAARFADAQLAMARAADRIEPDRLAHACGLLAIARLRLGDTNAALQLAREDLGGLRTRAAIRAPNLVPDRAELGAAATASMASARVWETVLALSEAVDGCEQGQRDWAAVGNAEAAADALRRRIELTLFELGDRQLAASLIGESLYLTVPAESEVAGRLQLLRALSQHPAPPNLADTLRRLLDNVAVRRWRVLRLHVLGALLDATEQPDPATVMQFSRDLAAVTPLAARLDVLATLAHLLDRPLRLSGDAAHEIASVVGLDEPVLPDDAGDAEHTRLAMATVEWLLGRPSKAAGHLEQLLPRLTVQPLAAPALELARRLVGAGQSMNGAPWGDRFRRREDATNTANGRVALALAELALRVGDLTTATERADEAVADLGGDAYPMTRWAAIAHTIAAAAARARGDTAGWQEHLARADRTLESLGQPRLNDAASRLTVPVGPPPAHGKPPKPSTPPASTPVPAGRPTATPGPDAASPQLTLLTYWRDGLVVEVQRDGVTIVPPTAPLIGPATELLGLGRDDEVVPFALVRRVADDWPAFAAELAGALMSRPELGHHLQHLEAPELRLVLDPPTVAALPVELLPAGGNGDIPLQAAQETRAVYRGALNPRELVRWIQESLVENGIRVVADGIWGPQGQRALAAFQTARGLPPTSLLDRRTVQLLSEGLVRDRRDAVALVAGAQEGARRGMRAGTSFKEHFDVTALYRAAGLRLESPGRNLVASLQARRPVVLHLCGTFDESTSLGGVVMRFSGGGEKDGPDGPGESPSTLGSALKLLPPVYRPIVVLDPMPATSHTEVARQLLLRNVFAHELFRIGACAAIIAVGFEVPTTDRVPAAYAAMAEAWKDRLSVLDLLRRLRSAAGRERRQSTDLVKLLRTSPSDVCVVYATMPAHTLFVRPRVPTAS
ncbi:MAG: peptidoglycan-binding protein [Gemmatimonadaceae bacterium]|nr:peptidoglycan-binding protein [Gemmatimonadaceae bacterium]